MTFGFRHTIVGIGLHFCNLSVPDVSVYDPVRRIWVWHYRDGDQQLDFDINTGEFIRFRVIAIQYNRVESGFCDAS